MPSRFASSRARSRRPKFRSLYHASTSSLSSRLSRPARSVKKPLAWLDQADAGNCEVVVKGHVAGESRGYVYVGSGNYESDRLADGTLTDATVRGFAGTLGQELTFTAVPPSDGTRIGVDRDDDGFHHEFRVRFDADVVSGDAIVYARLYLRRAGDRDWLLYRETDDFRISGQDGALDNNDFIVFIDMFFNADSGADMGIQGGLPGSDGIFDNNDFIAFINWYFTGCTP